MASQCHAELRLQKKLQNMIPYPYPKELKVIQRESICMDIFQNVIKFFHFIFFRTGNRI